MKNWLIAAMALTMLAGCGRNQNAEAERKLAEAQQKLDQAAQALEEAKKATDQAAENAGKAAENAGRAAQTAANAANPRTQGRTAMQTPTPAPPEKQAPAAPPAPAAAPPPPPPALKRHTLDAGTRIPIRTTTQISTKTAEAGSRFEATLAEPLEVDGYTVARKGATVEGVVVEANDGGRVKGKASLILALTSIKTADGDTVEIRTNRSTQEAKAATKKDAAKVGIASGIGAAIGAIAGGGKGAAIGAGAGAAGGTGVVLATKGDAAVIPSESLLTFTLAAPVTIVESRR